jgi:hypothetical protein
MDEPERVSGAFQWYQENAEINFSCDTCFGYSRK